VAISTSERLTGTSDDLPPDLYGYAAMHQGMHRDAARLVATLDRGAADPAALERWWRLFRDTIVRHHVREDDLIWPALEAADPSFADDVATMHDDHDELDRAMHRLDVALTALPVWPEALDEARRAARLFRQVLADHLAREEAVAFFRLAQRGQLWAEVDKEIVRQVSVREASFELPFVHDSLDPCRSSYLMGRLPRIARPLLRWVWRPRYQRLVSAAFGVSA
jgi:iron-sulfur cluster repair protein YtfE (RIC family)